MNDEIKEMLDIIEKVSKREENSRNGLMQKSSEKYKILLDYITNLQQKYDEANNAINWWSGKAKELQEENERLKETNVYCNRTDCSGRLKDSRKYDSVYQEKEDYKSRCEKAIEYINTWVCDEYSIAIQDPNDECFCSTEPNAVDNLLNILQNGSENNEQNK